MKFDWLKTIAGGLLTAVLAGPPPTGLRAEDSARAISPVIRYDDALPTATANQPAVESDESYGAFVPRDRLLDRVYGRVDYLMFWTQGNRVPALVTTSRDGTPRAEAGVLPGATILFGNDRIDTTRRDGLRTTIGAWLDNEQAVALEGTWLSIAHPSGSGSYVAASPGLPILARPFFNAATGFEDSQLVAFPDLLSGSVGVFTASDLSSGLLALRTALPTSPLGRIDLLGGYRYLRFQEVLSIREDLTATDPGGVIELGTRILVHDRFATTNEFHGADLGLALTVEEGMWTLGAVARVAVGNMHQRLVTSGLTTVTTPASSSFYNSGGLLVLPSNTVDDARNLFAVVPEFDLSLGCQLTTGLRLNVGYSLLLASSVMRTGDQIDRQIDATQLPTAGNGPPGVPADHPQATLAHSPLWAQGLSLGLEWRR